MGDITSLSRHYPAGEYTAYIGAINSAGDIPAVSVSFIVKEPSKPSNTWVKVSCGEVGNTTDDIELTWGATNATSYWLQIFKDGELITNESVGDITSLSRHYPVGEYTAYIGAINSAGDIPAVSVSFTVKEPYTIHSKGEFRHSTSDHPHYNYYTCSVCGKEYTDGSTTNDPDCPQC